MKRSSKKWRSEQIENAKVPTADDAHGMLAKASPYPVPGRLVYVLRQHKFERLSGRVGLADIVIVDQKQGLGLGDAPWESVVTKAQSLGLRELRINEIVQWFCQENILDRDEAVAVGKPFILPDEKHRFFLVISRRKSKFRVRHFYCLTERPNWISRADTKWAFVLKKK